MANETNGESEGRKPGDSEIPSKIEDVVLYDGPLSELNAMKINLRRQYELGGVLCFNSKWYSLCENDRHNSDDFSEAKEELIGRGFIGLVNRKTAYIWNFSNGRMCYRVEGTPIVPERVGERSKREII